MAYPAELSTAELARVAGLAYETRSVRVSLALLGSSGFDRNSTTAQWDTIKISGNGYADYTTTIATGAYDSSVDARYEMGQTSGANTYVESLFTASGGGAGFTFDRAYTVIAGAANIHSVIALPVTYVAPGQPVRVKVQLIIGF